VIESADFGKLDATILGVSFDGVEANRSSPRSLSSTRPALRLREGDRRAYGAFDPGSPNPRAAPPS
jgi:hypothetical protein